jgi:hypothetical protein
MKFLVIAKLKDVTLTLPPAILMPIFEASVSAMNQQKKEGKLLDFYYSPGAGRLVGMLNYDNAEQWQKDQTKIPILMYMDYESYPLANYDEYVKNYMEAMKAAAAIMPPAPK